jgi:hypothetical protein
MNSRLPALATATVATAALATAVVAVGPTRATAEEPTPRIQAAHAAADPVVVGISTTQKLHAFLAVTESSTRRADVVVDTPRRIFRTPLVEGESYDHLTFWDADIPIAPSSLRDSEAGRWMTTFRVLDREPESRVTLEAQVLRATRATVDARPEPVRSGATVTVTGRLERASWDSRSYRGYGGQPVVLEFRTETGSYQAVKTVTTAADGSARTSLKASQDGFYRFRFAGNGTSGASRAAGDHVDVR